MRPHGAPSQRIGRELGTHKRSCPDLKRLTMFAMLGPDLNAVRVPDANLKGVTSVGSANVNPNEVRVRLRANPPFERLRASSFLARTKNAYFPNWKLPVSYPRFGDGH